MEYELLKVNLNPLLERVPMNVLPTCCAKNSGKGTLDRPPVGLTDKRNPPEDKLRKKTWETFNRQLHTSSHTVGNSHNYSEYTLCVETVQIQKNLGSVNGRNLRFHSCSVAQSCLFAAPRTAAHQASLSFTISQSLLNSCPSSR